MLTHNEYSVVMKLAVFEEMDNKTWLVICNIAPIHDLFVSLVKLGQNLLHVDFNKFLY